MSTNLSFLNTLHFFLLRTFVLIAAQVFTEHSHVKNTPTEQISSFHLKFTWEVSFVNIYNKSVIEEEKN